MLGGNKGSVAGGNRPFPFEAELIGEQNSRGL